jgi:hypothetical protein
MLITGWSAAKRSSKDPRQSGRHAGKQAAHTPWCPGCAVDTTAEGQTLEIGQNIKNLPAKFTRQLHTHSTTPHHTTLRSSLWETTVTTILHKSTLLMSWASGGFITTNTTSRTKPPTSKNGYLTRPSQSKEQAKRQGGAGQARRSKPST